MVRAINEGRFATQTSIFPILSSGYAHRSPRNLMIVTETPPIFPLSPLASVLIDIERSVNAKLYYPALLVALTVPEICMALKLDKSEFVKERHYVEFVDTYTKPPDLGLSGIDCYRLRGGVVHRANMAGHHKFGATHVLFSIPETAGGLHALSIKVDEKIAACFDLVQFCQTMVSAANRWYADHKDDRKVKENMQNLIRYCPDGVFPFFNGAPLVASGR
jgi:hypothetical protein